MSPFKVPLAGFFYTKYYFFNLQSMGDENVINAPVEQLVEAEISDSETM